MGGIRARGGGGGGGGRGGGGGGGGTRELIHFFVTITSTIIAYFLNFPRCPFQIFPGGILPEIYVDSVFAIFEQCHGFSVTSQVNGLTLPPNDAII